jgi:hypothetical protein
VSGFPPQPLAVVAPVVDTPPGAADYGQVVRVIGPVDVVVVGGTIAILQPTTGTVAKIAQSIVSVVLAAADLTRMGLTIYNDSNKDLHVRCSAGAATVDNWTVKLRKDDYYELPFPAYTGAVTGIWAVAGAGQARVTAFTEP